MTALIYMSALQLQLMSVSPTVASLYISLYYKALLPIMPPTLQNTMHPF